MTILLLELRLREVNEGLHIPQLGDQLSGAGVSDSVDLIVSSCPGRIKRHDHTCFLPTGAYGSRGRESKCKNIVREMQERLWGFRGGRACIQMKRMTFCRDFITCLLRDHAGVSVFPAGLTLVSSLVYFKLCTCRVQVGEIEEV